jgi:hypothetical protein
VHRYAAPQRSRFIVFAGYCFTAKIGFAFTIQPGSVFTLCPIRLLMRCYYSRLGVRGGLYFSLNYPPFCRWLIERADSNSLSLIRQHSVHALKGADSIVDAPLRFFNSSVLMERRDIIKQFDMLLNNSTCE